MENNTSAAPIKKHQILKYVIDNDLLQKTHARFNCAYVCNVIKQADDKLYSSDEYRHSFGPATTELLTAIRRSISPFNTVTQWLECGVNNNYQVQLVAGLQYRKDWVQAMYEACLERDE